MSRSGPNPVLAPVRRWVLYSRTNLAISVVGVVAVLSLVGMLVGEQPQPQTVEDTSATGPETAAATADALTYELDEVSESQVVATTAAQTAASAPATAMAYAHTFVDTTLSDTQWTSALGRYTVSEPGPATVAARARTPVIITGPTVSIPVAGPAGTQSSRVLVPTQTGEMTVSVVVKELSDGTQRWVVDTPLPTLELSDVDDTAPRSTAPTTTRAPTEATTPRPTPTSSLVPTPQPTSAPNEPEQEPTPSRSAAPAPVPVPVPGPIPIPELDTPIPGQL
uniref:Putative transmembrane protein n=1 Tax=Rhodococcus sp. PY11 TaxID=551544 RepID=B5MA93_9NOCA|nr:putative transmembrane protein [Rhodococcus sp. PY11]